jgi:hypothetical protein
MYQIYTVGTAASKHVRTVPCACPHRHTPHAALHTQAHQISCKASDFVLRRHLEHRMTNYGDTQDEALQHCAKYMVSGSLYGTPSWYRRWYYDMRCMFNSLGIPTIFLTLTADEVSDTRFPEIDQLDATLRQVMPLDPGYAMPWRVGASAVPLLCLPLMMAARHAQYPATVCLPHRSWPR